MNKRIFFICFVFLSFLAMGQNVKVVYDFRTYYSLQGNYAEINTSIDGFSLNVKKGENNKWVKSAELTTIICGINAPDSAIYVDKRVIKSPEVEDSNQITNASLLDMQRVSLDNGEYVVFFEIRDMASTNQPLQYRDVIKINYPQDNISMSDIMIADTIKNTTKANVYTRGNKDIIPNVFNTLSLSQNILTYYVEVYNADKTFGVDSVYALVTSLENITTGKKVENIQNIKRIKAQDVSTYMAQLDVSSLIEGSYYLSVEVRNGRNILYEYKRLPFYKESNIKPDIFNMEIPSNSFVNFIADSILDENLLCLLPIASENERSAIQKTVKSGTPEQKRYLIYEFYKRLDNNYPESAWKQYMTAVDYVNAHYSTQIKKGYDTDMGRVYLLYGIPDNVIDEKYGASSGFHNSDANIDRVENPYSVNNPNSVGLQAMGVDYYPYQIWVYNTTPNGESNRKFVFYARQDNLIEYFLLHSNARGEVQDIFWENTLSRGFLEPGIEGKAGKQFRVGHE